MIRRLPLFIGVLISFVLMAPAAHAAQERVALVIGNGAYINATKLNNPVNDAGDIAQALRKIGFDVVEGRDLDKRAMEAKILEFGRKLDRANIALFFYAGHGMQVGGRNFLIPTDAKLERAGDLNFETLDVSLVLAQMEAEKRVNLVFLDACRDNPLARTFARSLGASRSAAIGRGLASIQSAVGTMIAYATQPDNVALDGTGRNSPFTAAMLKHIATPGLEIRSLMTRVRADVLEATRQQQLPWDHSSLIGEVVLVPGGTAQAAPPPPTVSSGDEFAWSLLKDSKDANQIRRFIEQFPNSARRSEAAARLLSLEQAKVAAMPPPQTSPSPPPALISSDAIRPVVIKRTLDEIKSKGQIGEITSFVFSSDSRYVAAASREGRLLVMDVNSGRKIHDLPSGYTTGSVAFAPDGRRLLSADHYGNISIWDSVSGRLILKIDAKDGGVFSLAFSPDGSRFASGHGNKLVNLWDAATGKKLQTLSGHGDGWVTAVAFSPDGRRLASGGQDKRLLISDIATGGTVHTAEFKAQILNIRFSRDGRRVAIDAIPTVILDTETWEHIYEFKGSDITAGFAPDSRHVVQKSGTTITIHHADTGQEVRRINAEPLQKKLDVSYLGSAVAVSPDGKWVATSFSPNLNRFLKANNPVRGADGFTRTLPSTDLDHIIVIWPLDPVAAPGTAAR